MRHLSLFEDFNFDKSLKFKDINELVNKLREFSIPISSWGTGKAKTVEELYDEIKNNECALLQEGDTLVRMIEFVGVKVYYRDDKDNLFYLDEDRQEFYDGRTRRRSMPASVSEKMIFGESPLLAAQRGIKEELNVDISISQLAKGREVDYNGGSMSYPGLKAKYKGHRFNCMFNLKQFNLEGYIETQKTKKTYFKWIKK